MRFLVVKNPLCKVLLVRRLLAFGKSTRTRTRFFFIAIVLAWCFAIRTVCSRFPNLPKPRYSAECEQALLIFSSARFGPGFPNFQPDWRRYLWRNKTPRENLVEIVGAAKKRGLPFEKLVVDDVVSWMRLIFSLRFHKELVGGRFFSHDQIRTLAINLLMDARVDIRDGQSIEKGAIEVPFGKFAPDALLKWCLCGTALCRPAMMLLGCFSKTVKVFTEGRISTMHYYERPGYGPPIVFLHGGFSCGMWWAGISWFMTGRLILLDLSDMLFGFSSSVPPSTGIENHVEIVEAFLQSPEIASKGTVIVGHSLGGTFAWVLACRKRVDIAAAVFLAPATGHFAHTWGQNPMIVVKDHIRQEIPYRVDQFLQRAMAKVFASPELLNVTFVSDWEDFHGAGVDKDGNIETVDVPVLLLWGADDDICIPRQEEHLLAAFRQHCPHPMSQGMWIEGAGHAFILTRAAALGRRISEFVEVPGSLCSHGDCVVMPRRAAPASSTKDHCKAGSSVPARRGHRRRHDNIVRHLANPMLKTHHTGEPQT
eukprot:GEMP01017093.1.p1 GENE.GEMP01017093.1~~GEMP01017093.1.p1  ORF type:complete len:545 (+),score=91.66 GEMP01017093.1:24-1637(+)